MPLPFLSTSWCNPSSRIGVPPFQYCSLSQHCLPPYRPSQQPSEASLIHTRMVRSSDADTSMCGLVGFQEHAFTVAP